MDEKEILQKVNEEIGKITTCLTEVREDMTKIRVRQDDIDARIPGEDQEKEDRIIADLVPLILESQQMKALIESNDKTQTLITRMQDEDTEAGIDTDEKRMAILDWMANGDSRSTMFPDAGMSERSKKYFNDPAVVTETRRLNETIDWQGGIFVTPEQAAEIQKLANDENPLAPICRNIVLTQTNAITFPKRTTLVTAYRTGEGGTGTESESEYGEQTITAHNLMVLTKATRDVLADEPLLESFITEDAGEAIGLKTGSEIIEGSAGTGLEGITINGDISSVAGAETVANTITSTDFAKMYTTLKTKYRANSTFAFTSATLGVVMKMISTTGAFIWQETLKDGPAGTIVGRPYILCEAIDEEGSGKYPVFLGDWKKGYFVVNRSQIEVVRDPLTSKPNVEFLFVMRNGGAVVTAEAIKKLSI